MDSELHHGRLMPMIFFFQPYHAAEKIRSCFEQIKQEDSPLFPYPVPRPMWGWEPALMRGYADHGCSSVQVKMSVSTRRILFSSLHKLTTVSFVQPVAEFAMHLAPSRVEATSLVSLQKLSTAYPLGPMNDEWMRTCVLTFTSARFCFCRRSSFRDRRWQAGGSSSGMLPLGNLFTSSMYLSSSQSSANALAVVSLCTNLKIHQ